MPLRPALERPLPPSARGFLRAPRLSPPAARRRSSSSRSCHWSSRCSRRCGSWPCSPTRRGARPPPPTPPRAPKRSGCRPVAAARAHLPARLERGLRLRASADGRVKVTVRVPSVVRAAPRHDLRRRPLHTAAMRRADRPVDGRGHRPAPAPPRGRPRRRSRSSARERRARRRAARRRRERSRSSRAATPRAAARAALPGWPRRRTRITVAGRRVRVAVTPRGPFGARLRATASADAGVSPSTSPSLR